MYPDNLKELAAQLRKPNGDAGAEVAKTMFTSNIGMIRHSIQCLNVQSGNKILEIGHGNGAHISALLTAFPDVHYNGLEISELMHQQAIMANKDLADKKLAEFHLYDGEVIPFEDEKFDKIFTVNTIYFWNHPEDFLKELYRVLQPTGVLCITFALKDFMKQLPFVQYGFQLYSHEDIQDLVKAAQFKNIETQTQTETVTSKSGNVVERTFSTFILHK